MIRLAIDTSCEKSSLAVEIDGAIAVSVEHQSHKLQTGFFKLIKQVFDENEISSQSIDSIIVGLGPGSFTGVRIGVSFAKSFCQLTGAKLVGVPSFFLSLGNYEIDKYYLSVTPSTQSECYATLFSIAENNTVEIIHEIDDGKPERLIDLAMNLPVNSELVVFGEGVGMLDQNHFPQNVGTRFLSPDLSLPKAERAFGFCERHISSCLISDPLKLTPLYVRPSPAELVWLKKRAK